MKHLGLSSVSSTYKGSQNLVVMRLCVCVSVCVCSACLSDNRENKVKMESNGSNKGKAI